MDKIMLYNYKNGDYDCSIYDDGTFIRETNVVNPQPKFPSSIDVKITDRCYNNCPYCYTDSHSDGNHGDLEWLLEILKPLPSGVEIAIGGGDALLHPNLKWLLKELKKRGLIANLTINQKSLRSVSCQKLIDLSKRELIQGIGISVVPGWKYRYDYIKELQECNKNIVYHLIAGIHTPEAIDILLTIGNYCKILVLGYKVMGRGWNSRRIQECLDRWYQQIPQYLGKCLISFDNLAISQLNIKRLFTDKGWKSFYMGKDGDFSCYIDTIKKKITKNSISDEPSKFFNSKEVINE